jgi:hypothetical protein
LRSIATRADRSGLFKTISLKNRFGITGPQGKLLAYSYREDVPESMKVGDFFIHLLAKRSFTLYMKLSTVYQRLQGDNKDLLKNHFNTFCDTGYSHRLIELMERNNISVELRNECKQICEDLVELRKWAEEAANETEIIWHPFAKSDDKTQQKIVLPSGYPYGIYDELQENPWLGILNKEQDFIRNCNAGGGVSEDYDALKKRMMDVNATPRSIAGYDENEVITEQDLKKRYHKAARTTHPDRVRDQSDEVKKEAEIMFKLYQKVDEILKNSL